MIIDHFKVYPTRLKLIFIYVLSLTIICTILILTFQIFSNNIFREQVQSQLSALSKSKSAQVASIIEQDLEHANLIASRTQMRLSLIEMENNPDKAEQSRLTIINILKDASKSVSAIRSIDVLNMSGTVVASTTNDLIGKNESKNVMFLNAIEKPYQGDFAQDSNGDNFYILSLPLLNPNLNESETIGVVRIELSLERLMSVLEDYVGLGKTGEILLFSKDEEINTPLNTFRITRSETLIDNISKILDSEESFQPGDNFDLNKFLAYYKVPLDAKNWYIVALIDTDEVMAPFNSLYIYIILFSLFLLVLGCVFIIYGINFSFKNIKKLAEGAQRFGEGELSYRVEISEKDEVGMLSLCFNSMADHISQQIKTILDSKNQLEKSKIKIESANIAKSQFLANMSHEIRTPINAIVGFLQLFKYTPLNTEQNEYVRLMQTSSDTLLSVINDILNVSKIESGTLDIEHIDFNLKSEIENAVLPLSVKANEKAIKLSITFDDYVPKNVVGDPVKIKQIIINLVANAIKFTDMGEISVNVKAYKNDTNSDYIRFSVKDTGIGMTQETILKLFKPFSQADSSSARIYGGTGLGLAICKAYTEAMDGKLTVESEIGKGSEFSFVVPFSKSNDDIILSAIPPVTHPSMSNSNINILLVEDNEINCLFVTKLLQFYGLVCDVAINGEDALKACAGKTYDLIFMDCQMPIMDGYETTRRIRSSEGNSTNARIVAITAYTMADDRQKCIDAGMDDYISKPIKFDIFDKLIKSLNQGVKARGSDVLVD